MKTKGPSNVFTLPNWMKNLRAKEPEGTYTPDQVASSLELCMLFNNSDVAILKDAIVTLVPRVPLKRQARLVALTQGDVLTNVQAFIAEVNILLAPLLKEQSVHEDRPVDLPAADGQSLIGSGYDADDDVRFLSRKRSRGHRAVRAAKRQQVDA